MQVEGMGFVYTQPIYDTVHIAATGTGATFFSVPFGGVLVSTTLKTYADTNLVQAGRLEQGISFNVESIALYVKQFSTPATLADIALIQAGGFKLSIGQVEVLKVPTALIPPSSAELLYFSNITPAATEFKVNRGVPAFGNRFVLDKAIQIAPQESIQADLTTGAVTAAVQLVCVLFGTMTRPVR